MGKSSTRSSGRRLAGRRIILTGAASGIGRATAELVHREGMAATTSIHHGHTPEIEIISLTTAAGIWPMQDWIWWPAGETSPAGDKRLVGWGHYHETYAKIGGDWLISSVTLKRIKIDRA